MSLRRTEDPTDDLWDDGQRGALVALIAIQPDLSEIVDDRKQRRKFWLWTRRVTHAAVEFLKWAAMIGAAVGLLKAGLQGWLK